MSDFVPMTRERLRNFSDGAVEGFVEQLAETALAYLDRAERAEQEASRERARAEQWKALAEDFCGVLDSIPVEEHGPERVLDAEQLFERYDDLLAAEHPTTPDKSEG